MLLPRFYALFTGVCPLVFASKPRRIVRSVLACDDIRAAVGEGDEGGPITDFFQLGLQFRRHIIIIYTALADAADAEVRDADLLDLAVEVVRFAHVLVVGLV